MMLSTATTTTTTTAMMWTTTTCTTEGCCRPYSEAQHALTTTSTTTAVKNSVRLTKETLPIVVQELYKTALHIPTNLGRLATEVWSHFFVQRKKPHWNIQQTVVMAFLQSFRDQTLTHSLEFWRFMLIAPTWLTPLTSKTQDGSFRVRRRNLRGILRKMDKSEDGSRMLEVEWMSAGTIWDRCQSVIHPGADRKDSEEEASSNYTQQSSALVLRTRSPEKIVFYLHGGAYCAMSAQTHRTLTHKISKATGRRVFAVNYRLAPEHKFPSGLYDAVQAFLYLIDAENGYCLEPKNILIMGDSAGGGLSLAMMLYLRDHGLPQPEGAVLLSPWVDLSFSYPSWDNASLYDYLPNNPDRLEEMNPAHLYLGVDKAAHMVRHPYVSPIFSESFENLPPLVLQSGSCESLRDEINDLVQKIAASKSTLVHHEEYEDMVHVFQAFPFGKSAEAIESVGWWARYGMPMIANWAARGQLPTVVQQNQQAEEGPFALKSTPRSMGRRFHSIPG
ncbi:alpha/beta hydrolase fold-domain-containing protein [Zychaea mexicana]|uniref:alpha/beta hydrolase fold-domain-containing protein n=1 Tax=Zychaea mexicana TaxID=64656 RepID=UPI0022FE5CB3|nr:alpha/beta hydrolase fold-domain-containing protein [Zychaea mexicana]KAI9490200.1 alpha/beta hydrolase fold-domain-containing protein [Zychaea mexicana]